MYMFFIPAGRVLLYNLSVFFKQAKCVCFDQLTCSFYQLTLFFLCIVDPDITGSQDGCVRIWDWTDAKCVNEVRKPGAFPKVTKVLFNAQGNKVSFKVYFSLFLTYHHFDLFGR